MKKQLMFTIALLSAFTLMAQTKPADTVVIRVGESSKVIFAIQDKKDLETLKYYNFQALMEDMITKLENNDSTSLTKSPDEYLKDSVITSKPMVTVNRDEDEEDDDDANDDDRTVRHVSRGKRTRH